MSTPIAYQKPKSGRLLLLFLLSVAAHVGLAMLAIWAGNHLGRVQKPALSHPAPASPIVGGGSTRPWGKRGQAD